MVRHIQQQSDVLKLLIGASTNTPISVLYDLCDLQSSAIRLKESSKVLCSKHTGRAG